MTVMTIEAMRAALTIAEIDARTPEGQMNASQFVEKYLGEAFTAESPAALDRDISHGRAMIRTMKALGAIA